MAQHYNVKAERDRKEKDNDPERIKQIAQAKGKFEVSLRWRDDGLRRICQRMVKRGELLGGRRVGDRQVFYPVRDGPADEVRTRIALFEGQGS